MGNESGDLFPVRLDYTAWHPDAIGEVLCPVCGATYHHRRGPNRVFNGSDEYAAGWPGRGDLTVIAFNGECGSAWELCVGEHKGGVALFARVILACGVAP